jgi:hypothetical protein
MVFEYEVYIRKQKPEWVWGAPLDIELPCSEFGIRKFISNCVKYGKSGIGDEVIELDDTYLKEYHLTIVAKENGYRTATITSTVDETTKGQY